MTKQIQVEDYGATLAEAIIKLSATLKNSPLTNRALAVLLHDYNKGVTLGDCLTIVETLPHLAEYYTK